MCRMGSRSVSRRSEISHLDTPRNQDANGGPRLRYQDVEQLENSHGLLSVISQHRNGSLTFAMFKLYNRFAEDGVTVERQKTQFCPADLGPQYIEHVRLTLERIEALKKTPGKLPFPLPK